MRGKPNLFSQLGQGRIVTDKMPRKFFKYYPTAVSQIPRAHCISSLYEAG